MLSGTGRPLREVLHDQFATTVDSATAVRADTAFVRFLRGEDVSDAPEIARPVLVPGYHRLFVSMAAYDPEREIANARLPVLIVQGGMDLQVTARDAERGMDRIALDRGTASRLVRQTASYPRVLNLGEDHDTPLPSAQALPGARAADSCSGLLHRSSGPYRSGNAAGFFRSGDSLPRDSRERGVQLRPRRERADRSGMEQGLRGWIFGEPVPVDHLERRGVQ
jgi:hypothetical protein